MITIQTPRLRLPDTKKGNSVINTLLFLFIAGGITYGVIQFYKESKSDKSKDKK